MVSTRQFPDRLFPRKVRPKLDKSRRHTQNSNRYLESDTSRFGSGRSPLLDRYIFSTASDFVIDFLYPDNWPEDCSGAWLWTGCSDRQTDVFGKRAAYYIHSEYDFPRFLPAGPLGASEKKRIDKSEYFQMMSRGRRFETRILLRLNFADLFLLERSPKVALSFGS